MLRAVFLWLSEQPRIFGFVRKNRLARKLASRFVAGETIDEAIATVRDVNTSNLSASLDLLGESVLHSRKRSAPAAPISICSTEFTAPRPMPTSPSS